MTTGCDWPLRQAAEQDLDAVLGILRRSPSAPQWTPAQCREILVGETHAAQRRTTLLTEQSGVVIGFVVVQAVCSISPPEAELENIVVAPDRRGKGVGALLLEAAIAWAILQKASCLRLEVRASNNSAIRLYRRCGFVPRGTRPRYYAGPVEDALCMERVVS